ncbi:threonine-phosphate decarboxylase CobD [Oxalobacteraceae bacterium A2-2]
MLEHGGNLRDAALHFGRDDWLDLSTGINPRWYPAPQVADNAWHRLPEPDPALARAAAAYYGAPLMLPVAGTQAAIQALPRLRAPSRVTVSAPSYAEHAHHWQGHGHTLTQSDYGQLAAAVPHSDVVVVVNPNNPTGATIPAAQLLDWAAQLAARGGWLVVDEAFGDTAQHNSVAAHSRQPGLIVLRSVGKFFGLAGIRLGFVAAHQDLLRQLEDLLGPWTISGPAQQIALAALADSAWQHSTRTQLAASGERLRALLAQHGIQSGGTALFQWWPEPQAEACWRHMAERGIWVRLFKHAARGIRLGLPPDEAGWLRLQLALKEWSQR